GNRPPSPAADPCKKVSSLAEPADVQTKSGANTAFTTTAAPESCAPDASHHTAPFFTAQKASRPVRSVDTTSPRVGWWATTSTASRDSGQPAAASTARGEAPGAR